MRDRCLMSGRGLEVHQIEELSLCFIINVFWDD